MIRLTISSGAFAAGLLIGATGAWAQVSDCIQRAHDGSCLRMSFPKSPEHDFNRALGLCANPVLSATEACRKIIRQNDLNQLRFLEEVAKDLPE